MTAVKETSVITSDQVTAWERMVKAQRAQNALNEATKYNLYFDTVARQEKWNAVSDWPMAKKREAEALTKTITRGTHAPRCPAFGEVCIRYGKKNHYESMHKWMLCYKRQTTQLSMTHTRTMKRQRWQCEDMMW